MEQRLSGSADRGVGACGNTFRPMGGAATLSLSTAMTKLLGLT
jgi:hypothetical protein